MPDVAIRTTEAGCSALMECYTLYVKVEYLSTNCLDENISPHSFYVLGSITLLICLRKINKQCLNSNNYNLSKLQQVNFLSF